MRYEELNEKIEKAKLLYNTRKSRADFLVHEKENLENKLTEIDVDLCEKIALTLQDLAKNQREKAKSRLEELGTKALQYSIGDEYRMVIHIDNSRKRPLANVKLLNVKTQKETDPLSDNGGGVLDIISAALRVVVIHSSSDPIIDGPIILDEPFKMLSKEYIPAIAEFLQNISKDFNRQIILITHNTYLAECCDKVITISKDE